MKASVVHCIGLACLTAALLLSAETFWLAHYDRTFLFDLGGEAACVAAIYGVFGLAVGVTVGLLRTSRLRQHVTVALIFYVAIAIKFLGDAGLIHSPVVLGGALVGSIIIFTGLYFIGHRRKLHSAGFALFVLAIFVTFQLIQSSWAKGGGKLAVFLTSPRTIAACVIGLSIFGSDLALTWILERFNFRRLQWTIIPIVFSSLGLGIITESQRHIPSSSRQSPAGGKDRPDVYVISIDALRSDALTEYAASHPAGRLRFLIDHGTNYTNVVSDGVTTYDILANNTFADPEGKRSCEGSIPRIMQQAGYRSAMLLGRYGRRIEGAECYDRYYAGAGVDLRDLYILPRVLNLAVTATPWRPEFIASPRIVAELGGVMQRTSSPVYAYMHLLDLHAPAIPEKFKQNSEYLSDLKKYMSDCYAVACDPNEPSNAIHISHVRSAYMAGIEDVEARIDEIYQHAIARGRPFTIVITADHGELFGEHGGFAHSGGFVPELLHVPFVAYNSKDGAPKRRCDLLLSSEALRLVTNAAAGNPALTTLPNQKVQVIAPQLGQATISAASGTISFEITSAARAHAGTWRNIHKQSVGTEPYPIDRCVTGAD